MVMKFNNLVNKLGTFGPIVCKVKPIFDTDTASSNTVKSGVCFTWGHKRYILVWLITLVHADVTFVR